MKERSENTNKKSKKRMLVEVKREDRLGVVDVLAARISPETTGATTVPRKIPPSSQPQWHYNHNQNVMSINN